MPQGLHLSQRLTQSLVLAPQLQQSLALLQAPTLELKALVEQELQQNPVLEEAPAAETDLQEKDDSEAEQPAEAADPSEPPADLNFDPATERALANRWMTFRRSLSGWCNSTRNGAIILPKPICRCAPPPRTRRSGSSCSIRWWRAPRLQEMLLEQVRESALPEDQWPIAEMLIGNIDEYGYLKATVEELAASTGLPPDQIAGVLKVIQTFDPPGVGARDLRECLLLQFERLGQQNTLEYRIVNEFMDALGKRRIPEIARGTGTSVDEVQEALERIARLEPRPGRAYLPDNDQYILPEVFVRKSGDDYVVTTNNEHIPHLRISNTYKDLMAQGENSAEVRNYIREKIRAGKFLIKSLHQRQQTILNIAKEIVHRQREFMAKGVAALKPLTMVQVAEVVGVHETTVSRAVSGKYMQTPQGIFEMKYFFTAGIQTASGTRHVQHQREGHDRGHLQGGRSRQTALGSGSGPDAQGKGHRDRPPHGGEVSHRAEHPALQFAQGLLSGTRINSCRRKAG